MKTIYFILIYLFLIISCKGETECDNVAIPVESSFLPMTGAYFKNADEKKSEESIIINSQAEFIEVIGGNELMPDIDFSKDFLLAVKWKFSHCGEASSASITLECETLVNNLEIIDGLCQKPTDIYFFSVVPNRFKTYPFSLRTRTSSL